VAEYQRIIQQLWQKRRSEAISHATLFILTTGCQNKINERVKQILLLLNSAPDQQ
jgi:hypothetical protein